MLWRGVKGNAGLVLLEIAMKDHEKRELVSRITAVALEYRDAEQLRERIRGAVLPAIDAAVAAERERIFGHIRGAMGYAEAGYDDVAWRLLATLVGPDAALQDQRP